MKARSSARRGVRNLGCSIVGQFEDTLGLRKLKLQRGTFSWRLGVTCAGRELASSILDFPFDRPGHTHLGLIQLLSSAPCCDLFFRLFGLFSCWSPLPRPSSTSSTICLGATNNSKDTTKALRMSPVTAVGIKTHGAKV